MNLNINTNNGNERSPDSSPSSPLPVNKLEQGVTSSDVDSIVLDVISMEGSGISAVYRTNIENPIDLTPPPPSPTPTSPPFRQPCQPLNITLVHGAHCRL